MENWIYSLEFSLLFIAALNEDPEFTDTIENITVSTRRRRVKNSFNNFIAFLSALGASGKECEISMFGEESWKLQSEFCDVHENNNFMERNEHPYKYFKTILKNFNINKISKLSIPCYFLLFSNFSFARTRKNFNFLFCRAFTSEHESSLQLGMRRIMCL